MNDTLPCPPANLSPPEADTMAQMREMLVEQAYSLSGLFADLTSYAADVFTDKKQPAAAQAYLRLALRAQSNCRASVETIAKAARVAQQEGTDAEK